MTLTPAAERGRSTDERAEMVVLRRRLRVADNGEREPPAWRRVLRPRHPAPPKLTYTVVLERLLRPAGGHVLSGHESVDDGL